MTAELASMMSGCGTCRLWSEQDEGPYHLDSRPERRDLVEDRQGTPLQLGVRLVDDEGHALAGAAVEIWHCDALGRYSGFEPPDDSVVLTAESAPRAQYLPDQGFLRGRQTTDAAGMVEFHSIYPGWYPGRTVHIHVMVHVPEHTFTSQLYFPEEVSDRVLSLEPYVQRPGRDTTNDTDTIFSTGEPALVEITGDTTLYRAVICLELPGRRSRSAVSLPCCLTEPGAENDQRHPYASGLHRARQPDERS